MRQLIRASPRVPRGCNKHPHLRVVLERLLSRLIFFATCRTFSSSLERVHLSVAVETVTTGGGSRFRFEPSCDHFWIVGKPEVITQKPGPKGQLCPSCLS